MRPLNPRTATLVRFIRLALLVGLLLFGGVTWFLKSRGPVNELGAEQLRVLGYAFMGMIGAALVGMVFFRTQLSKVTEPERQLSTYLSGYALAEGTALFGGILWYLGGQREWYVAGLVLMVVAFQILPVRR